MGFLATVDKIIELLLYVKYSRVFLKIRTLTLAKDLQITDFGTSPTSMCFYQNMV